MKSETRVQSLTETFCVSLHAKTFLKDMDQPVLLQLMVIRSEALVI